MLNNQDFANLRAKSLGGSDIGAILGVNRYRSAVDVWLEKTGRKVPQVNNLATRFGQFAEEFVASEYSLSTDHNLVNHPRAIIHPQHDYMHGHVDRFVCDADRLFDESGALLATRILECKTANPFAQHEWGELGSDQVPMSYLAQCAWYMMITQIPQADLAVLFGNTDFRVYEIPRDLELEEMILERARFFWEANVLQDIPPKPQSESDLRSLFPKSQAGKSVEASHETIEFIKKLQHAQAQIESYEQEVSTLKQGIMAQMQDAEVLLLDGKTIATWKAPKSSLRVDTKRLTEDHPDIVAQYQVQSASSRRLVIKGVA